MKQFDIFITVAPKDYHKIPYVIKALETNISNISEIVLCSPTHIENTSIKQLRDDEVYKIDRSRIKFRSNWCSQQFLKLFQTVTKNEYYLTIDCDTIVNRPLEFFSNDKPIWYVGWEQNHQPYYIFNEKMFGFGRVYNHTFLADMNFFNRNIIQNLLDDYCSGNPDIFLEKAYSIIDENCHPSEADIYGNYFYLKYPDFYEIRQLKSKYAGRNMQSENNWNEYELSQIIENLKGKDVDTFGFHSWS